MTSNHVRGKETKEDTRRNVGKAAEDGSMENQIINLPTLKDGVVALGDLWDCRSSQAVGNLFEKPLTKDYLEANVISQQEYYLYRCKNTSDKNHTLHVDASLTLDLMNGMIKVSGKASYDESDTKKFNQEEIICNYDVSTYQVRVRPTVKDVVSNLVQENIVAGNIIATHFVQAVTLGGQASASVKFSENVSDTSMNITGEFEGKLVLGPVTAEAQASMKLLDDEHSSGYTTTITVKAQPKLKKTPASCAEMFTEIENIDTYTQNELHFPQLNEGTTKIMGVPLRFRLVPLAQLIDFEVESLYRMLKEDLMNDFTSMLSTLQDFCDGEHVKAVLRDQEPSLTPVLLDEFHPVTARLTEWSQELLIKARSLKQEAGLLFGEYKFKKKTEEDLGKMIQKYDKEFNVTGVIAQIMSYREEMKRELTGIRASDVVGLADEEDKPVIRFFANEIDMKDWYNPERTIKILLRTNNNTASPSGVFLKLFDMSATLKKVGVEVGVAFPAISEDFSLMFKSQFKETKYQKDDIPFVLEVLGIAVEKGDAISNLFYSLNATLSGLHLPMQDYLHDIPSLVTVMKEYQGTIICETYCDLLAKLSETEGSWNFVCPIQGLNTGIEMMRFFRQLRKLIPEKFPQLAHRWIMSRFNITGQFSSPLLLVFRDDVLEAVCLDHLDILILLEQLGKATPDLSLISYKRIRESCIYTPRADFAINIIPNLILDHSSSNSDPIAPLEMFEGNNDESLVNALNITRTACMRDEPEVLAVVARLAIKDYLDLEPVLQEFGWKDNSFSKDKWKDVDFSNFNDALNTYLGSSAPDLMKVFGAINELEKLKDSETAEDQWDEKIDQIVDFLLEQAERTRGRTRVYLHRGVSINEDDVFKDLKDEVQSYTGLPPTVRRQGILKALEAFYNGQISLDKYFNLFQLTALVKELSDTGSLKSLLVLLSKSFCQRVKLENTDYPRAPRKLEESLTERQLFKTLGILSEVSYHPLLYTLHQEFFNLTALPAPTSTKSIIEKMTQLGYSKEQLEAIWTNPKFLYLLRQVVSNEGVLETLYVHVAFKFGNSEEDGEAEAMDAQQLEERAAVGGDLIINFPSFIPADIVEKIKPLIVSQSVPQYEWVKEWPDVNVLIEQLQIITTRKTIPKDFGEILRFHVASNKDIYTALKSANCLYYWNEKNEYFKHPWSLTNLSQALELLMNKPAGEPRKFLKLKMTKSEKNEEISEIKVEVNDQWKNLVRQGYLEGTRFSRFKKLDKYRQSVLVEYENLDAASSKIFPYIMQQLKLSNGTILSPKFVSKLINYPYPGPRPGQINFGDGIPNKNKGIILTRGDIQTALLYVSDPLVTHEFLVSMAKCSVALPLIVTSVEAQGTPKEDTNKSVGALPISKSKLLFPSLQTIIIPEMEALVPQPHLFRSPFRFVLTVRVGDTKAELGRSSLINEHLMKDKNTFSAMNEPGKSFGRALNRNGFVEFTWLSPSTCEEEFWTNSVKSEYESQRKEMILLGNLHGDALTLPSLFEILRPLISCYVVFWKVSNWNDLKAKKKQLTAIIGKSTEVLDVVLYPDVTIADHVHEQNLIHKSDDEGAQSNSSVPRSDEVNKAKIQRIFKEAIRFSTKLERIQPNDPTDEGEISPKISFLSFAGLGSPKGAKPLNTTAPIEIEVQQPLPTAESNALIQFIENNTIGNIKEAIRREDENFVGQFIGLFLNVISLPHEKRNFALHHFIYELDFLSRKSSQKIVQRIAKLRAQIDDTLLHSIPDDSWVLEIQEEIKAALDQLQLNTMTLQDLFRVSNITEFTNDQASYHNRVVDCINDGFVMELLNPSYSNSLLDWRAIMKNTFEFIPPHTRVFVVSIFGLKASGKSTLLNRLFGNGFTEASTTFGLQMRLLWLSDEMKKELDCDAFLILDSEGVGTAENKIDDQADNWERKLVTLLLGCSSVSIGNVLGSSMKELGPILEVAMTALSKINDMVTTPDVILVHQQLQGQPGVIEGEFGTSLAEVRKLEAAREIELGLRVREANRLQVVKSRFKHKEIIRKINPLGNPLEQDSNFIQYQSDIQALYQVLIDYCSTSRQKRLTMDTWYEFTTNLWEDIRMAPGPFQFKSVRSVEENFTLDEKISNVKKNIGAAFMYHEKKAAETFNEAVEKAFENYVVGFDAELERVLDELMRKLRPVVNTCEDNKPAIRRRELRTGAVNPDACAACTAAFNLREAFFTEISSRKRNFLLVDDITNYTNEIRDTIYNRFRQIVLARQLCERKSENIDKKLKQILEDSGQDTTLAWKRFLQYVSTLQFVIPARHRFNTELAEAYNSLPHVTKRHSENSPIDLPNLESLTAFEVQHYNAASESSMNPLKPEKLTWQQNDWLLSKLNDIPGTIFQELEVIERNVTYVSGMAKELRNKIQQTVRLFEEFCGEKLLLNFTWEVHYYGILLFSRYLDETQATWDKTNNPVVVLENSFEHFSENPSEFFEEAKPTTPPTRRKMQQDNFRRW